MPYVKFRHRIRVVYGGEDNGWVVYHGYTKLCSCPDKRVAVRVAKDYKTGDVLTC